MISSGLRNGVSYVFDNGPPSPSNTDVIDAAFENYSYCFHYADGTLSCDSTKATWLAFDQGSSFQCARKADNTLWCWGTDRSGSLGQGVLPELTEVTTPTQVGTDTDWAQLASAAGAVCAIKTTSSLWCWGAATMTGTGGVATNGVPTQIGIDTDWSWVDGHWSRICAGKQDGSIWCWGDDTGYDGDIVPGSFKVDVPTRIPDGPFDRWRLGGHMQCGHRPDGRWSCFGSNGWSQLGTGRSGFVHDFTDVCRGPDVL